MRALFHTRLFFCRMLERWVAALFRCLLHFPLAEPSRTITAVFVVFFFQHTSAAKTTLTTNCPDSRRPSAVDPNRRAGGLQKRSRPIFALLARSLSLLILSSPPSLSPSSILRNSRRCPPEFASENPLISFLPFLTDTSSINPTFTQPLPASFLYISTFSTR